MALNAYYRLERLLLNERLYRASPIISDGNAAAPHGVTVMLPTLLSP
jgi:hypothetical protein